MGRLLGKTASGLLGTPCRKESVQLKRAALSIRFVTPSLQCTRETGRMHGYSPNTCEVSCCVPLFGGLLNKEDSETGATRAYGN